MIGKSSTYEYKGNEMAVPANIWLGQAARFCRQERAILNMGKVEIVPNHFRNLEA
jgi:hypothetical protein